MTVLTIDQERRRLAKLGRDMLRSLPKSRNCFYPNTREEESRRALPSIADITIHLDETGDFAEMVVTTSRPLTRSETAACHHAAGELGAGIKFRGPK